MRFTSTLAAAAFAAPCLAAPSAENVVSGLDEITKRLDVSNDAANKASAQADQSGVNPVFDAYRSAVEAQQVAALTALVPEDFDLLTCLADPQACLGEILNGLPGGLGGTVGGTPLGPITGGGGAGPDLGLGGLLGLLGNIPIIGDLLESLLDLSILGELLSGSGLGGLLGGGGGGLGGIVGDIPVVGGDGNGGGQGGGLGGVLGGLGGLFGGLGRTKASSTAQETRAFTEAEQEQICTAFRTNGQTHSSLLNTMIKKTDVLSSKTSTTPLFAAMKADKSVSNSIVAILKEVAPNCAQDLQSTYDPITQKLDEAISQYK